jgi:hypothetical protein
VDKSCQYQPLPSPIRRVFYLSREGTGQEHEVAPQPNPHILQVRVQWFLCCCGPMASMLWLEWVPR